MTILYASYTIVHTYYVLENGIFYVKKKHRQLYGLFKKYNDLK